MGKTNDVQVYLLDGMTVNEAVTENEDGSYTIFINSDLCEAKKVKAIEHALKHIRGNDFGKTDIQEIEVIAHG